MIHRWHSYGGRITNGKRSLNFIQAYEYIDNGKECHPHLADPFLVMHELGMKPWEYQEFKDLVCAKLAIPSELCGDFEGE